MVAPTTDSPSVHGVADAQPLFSKVIFLSDNQEDVLNELVRHRYLKHSFVNGIAGTGKSTIAQFLLQDFAYGEEVLYLCPSESLANAQREQYEATIANEGQPIALIPNIVFKSIKDFYQNIGLLESKTPLEDYTSFCAWFKQVSDKDHALKILAKRFGTTDKQVLLYSEFKSMLNLQLSFTDAGLKNYKDLQIGLSLFEKNDSVRNNIFELFQSYINYLKTNEIACLELLGNHTLNSDTLKRNQYTQILIDEAQLLPYAP